MVGNNLCVCCTDIYTIQTLHHIIRHLKIHGIHVSFFCYVYSRFSGVSFQCDIAVYQTELSSLKVTSSTSNYPITQIEHVPARKQKQQFFGLVWGIKSYPVSRVYVFVSTFTMKNNYSCEENNVTRVSWSRSGFVAEMILGNLHYFLNLIRLTSFWWIPLLNHNLPK